MCHFGLSKWVNLVYDFMAFLMGHGRKRSKMGHFGEKGENGVKKGSKNGSFFDPIFDPLFQGSENGPKKTRLYRIEAAWVGKVVKKGSKKGVQKGSKMGQKWVILHCNVGVNGSKIGHFTL